MRTRGWAAALVLASGLLAACSDAKAVNAAFLKNQISWYLFNPDRADGLQMIAGLDEPLKVSWKPKDRSVRLTDLLVTTKGAGAVAVSGLGLLVLDDAGGSVSAVRPTAQTPLEGYETGRLFEWKGRVFMSLFQEPPGVLPPESLAWWEPGQLRMAFYPIPSQVRDPSKQAVDLGFSRRGTSLLTLQWKRQVSGKWVFESSGLNLEGGTEPSDVAPADEPRAQPGADDPVFETLAVRLADHPGTAIPCRNRMGDSPVLSATDAGWVAVGHRGDSAVRVYRLPELGAAGRYTGVLALARGFVFLWESSFRGYTGASGLVHVPYSILAP